jgi:hypothetical protein
MKSNNYIYYIYKRCKKLTEKDISDLNTEGICFCCENLKNLSQW